MNERSEEPTSTTPVDPPVMPESEVVWVVTRVSSPTLASYLACSSAIRGRYGRTKKEAWKKFMEDMRRVPGSEKNDWSIYRWKRDGVDSIRVRLTAELESA